MTIVSLVSLVSLNVRMFDTSNNDLDIRAEFLRWWWLGFGGCPCLHNLSMFRRHDFPICNAISIDRSVWKLQSEDLSEILLGHNREECQQQVWKKVGIWVTKQMTWRGAVSHGH